MKRNKKKRSARARIGRILWVSCLALLCLGNTSKEPAPAPAPAAAAIDAIVGDGPVLLMDVTSPITPATDDYLKNSIQKARARNARLLIIILNTPGGVLTSTQSIVEQLLASPVPTAVYVSPAGGSATSAGVFITMAANFAIMAPGTTIGSAHPVTGSGEDVQGDMRKKIENFAAAHIKAIAEQRSRNAAWAEKAVRESVSLTDRDAEKEKVIDFIAKDITEVLSRIEGKTTIIQGKRITVTGVSGKSPEPLPMTFRQQVVNFLSDPNIAILLGLGAMLGLGIEFYNPGLILPGLVGAICLVLSLVAGQVLPINQGGLMLLLLGAVFFVVELFSPTFGLWGAAGLVCLVLGSIYFIDTEQVWSVEGFEVNRLLVGSVAAAVGSALMGLCWIAVDSRRRRSPVGSEGLIDQIGVVKERFNEVGFGKVFLSGELWRARLAEDGANDVAVGGRVRVVGKDEDLTLVVEKTDGRGP